MNEERIAEIKEILENLEQEYGSDHIDADSIEIERTEKAGSYSRKEVKIVITNEGHLGRSEYS